MFRVGKVFTRPVFPGIVNTLIFGKVGNIWEILEIKCYCYRIITQLIAVCDTWVKHLLLFKISSFINKFKCHKNEIKIIFSGSLSTLELAL